MKKYVLSLALVGASLLGVRGILKRTCNYP